MNKILISVIFALFLFSGVAQAGTYRCQVSRVLDGDTVVCSPLHLGFGIGFNEEKVRLAGINTPESIRASCPEEKAAGLKAKDRLSGLVLGREVLLVTGRKERGKFGRVLGTLLLGGTEINKLLVEEAHAVPYDGGKRVNHWCPDS